MRIEEKYLNAQREDLREDQQRFPQADFSRAEFLLRRASEEIRRERYSEAQYLLDRALDVADEVRRVEAALVARATTKQPKNNGQKMRRQVRQVHDDANISRILSLAFA